MQEIDVVGHFRVSMKSFRLFFNDSCKNPKWRLGKCTDKYLPTKNELRLFFFVSFEISCEVMNYNFLPLIIATLTGLETDYSCSRLIASTAELLISRTKQASKSVSWPEGTVRTMHGTIVCAKLINLTHSLTLQCTLDSFQSNCFALILPLANYYSSEAHFRFKIFFLLLFPVSHAAESWYVGKTA